MDGLVFGVFNGFLYHFFTRDHRLFNYNGRVNVDLVVFIIRLFRFFFIVSCQVGFSLNVVGMNGRFFFTITMFFTRPRRFIGPFFSFFAFAQIGVGREGFTTCGQFNIYSFVGDIFGRYNNFFGFEEGLQGSRGKFRHALGREFHSKVFIISICHFGDQEVDLNNFLNTIRRLFTNI